MTFRSNTFRHSSSVISMNGRRSTMSPALFTRMSIGPSPSAACATTRSASSRAREIAADRDRLAAVRFHLRDDRFRAFAAAVIVHGHRRAARASSSATARPMPAPAPVTSAICPSSDVIPGSSVGCPSSAYPSSCACLSSAHLRLAARRRGADDQVAFEQDFAARRLAVRSRRSIRSSEEFRGEPALVIGGLAHRRQTRRHRGGQRNVIESRHRHIVRRAQPGFFQRLQRADRRVVVAREDRRRPRRQLEQLLHRAIAIDLRRILRRSASTRGWPTIRSSRTARPASPSASR